MESQAHYDKLGILLRDMHPSIWTRIGLALAMFDRDLPDMTRIARQDKGGCVTGGQGNKTCIALNHST